MKIQLQIPLAMFAAPLSLLLAFGCHAISAKHTHVVDHVNECNVVQTTVIKPVQYCFNS